MSSIEDLRDSIRREMRALSDLRDVRRHVVLVNLVAEEITSLVDDEETQPYLLGAIHGLQVTAGALADLSVIFATRAAAERPEPEAAYPEEEPHGAA